MVDVIIDNATPERDPPSSAVSAAQLPPAVCPSLCKSSRGTEACVSARTRPARLPLRVPPTYAPSRCSGTPKPTYLWAPGLVPFLSTRNCGSGWCFHGVGRNTYIRGCAPLLAVELWRIWAWAVGAGISRRDGPWPSTPGSSAVWSGGDE